MKCFGQALVCSALLSGCFSPEYGPDPFSCAGGRRCPQGYRCVQGICRMGEPSDGSPVEDLLRGDRGVEADSSQPSDSSPTVAVVHDTGIVPDIIPDTRPQQSTFCESRGVQFWSSAPPVGGAVLSHLTAKSKTPRTSVMVGVKVHVGDGQVDCAYFTGKIYASAVTADCNDDPTAFCAWPAENAPVPPGAGPFVFSLLEGAIGGDCAKGVEVAWCVP